MIYSQWFFSLFSIDNPGTTHTQETKQQPGTAPERSPARASPKPTHSEKYPVQGGKETLPGMFRNPYRVEIKPEQGGRKESLHSLSTKQGRTETRQQLIHRKQGKKIGWAGKRTSPAHSWPLAPHLAPLPMPLLFWRMCQFPCLSLMLLPPSPSFSQQAAHGLSSLQTT